MPSMFALHAVTVYTCIVELIRDALIELLVLVIFGEWLSVFGCSEQLVLNRVCYS